MRLPAGCPNWTPQQTAEMQQQRCSMHRAASTRSATQPARCCSTRSGHALPLHAHNEAANAPLLGRRDLLQASAAAAALQLLAGQPALAARGSVLRKKVPADQYADLPNGLKFYDLLPGSGNLIEQGTTCVVHWDVLYRGIDVVSSRQARLLGGNRTLAEPLEFVAGGAVRVALKDADVANPLFSGVGGPKPPPALSTAVLGMRPGGVRSVLVDKPELGYVKRMQEIPPGDPFELRVEVLQVRK